MTIGIGRRQLISALGGAVAAWPLATHAQVQATRPRRVGWLVGLTEKDPEASVRINAVLKTLQELGWTVGRNLQIDYRYTAGDSDHLDAQAAELIALAPDVLITNSTPGARALKKATSTIPIVFALVIDPITSGLVTSLARPGGNITGFTNFEASMGGKWLELLKTVSPRISKVALIFNPKTTSYEGMLRSIDAAAAPFPIEVTTRGVANAAELESAIAAAGSDAVTALIAFPDIFNTMHQEQIIALAKQHRTPAIYPYRYFAAGGGLMSYGIDTPDLFRQVAEYVDRILKGSKPADLPVQLPTKFELVLNLKTARELGLVIPDRLIALADQVIE